MKKTFLLVLGLCFIQQGLYAQNIDSFLISNYTPEFCDEVEVVSHSTPYTSLEWQVSGDYAMVNGTATDSSWTISIRDTGCFDIKLIGGRGATYDTVEKKCLFNVPFPEIISLRGKTFDSVQVHDHYIDPGYQAGLACASVVWDSVAGEVDTATIGTCLIRYFAALDNGLRDSVDRVVYVVDTIPPYLVLPIDTINAEVYYGYIPMVIVHDNYCAADELTLHWIRMADTSKLGVYHDTIWVEDCSGNLSEKLIQAVIVTDTTRPVINWSGPDTLFLSIGSGFSGIDDLIQVIDNYDSLLHIIISGTYYTDYLVDLKEGCYTITLNASDQSGNHANEVVVWICMSHSSIDQFQDLKIEVYPNPAHNYLVVDCPESGMIMLSLIDVNGKKVKELKLVGPLLYEKLDINELSTGMYLLQIYSGKKSGSVRIWKEKD